MSDAAGFEFWALHPTFYVDGAGPGDYYVYVQDFYNRKGLISDKGEKKKAFYILQKFYAELAKEQK